MGFLILHFTFDEENITDRPALSRASYVWLATIPMYMLGLLFFYLFYTKAHVWKSNGVVVGYRYSYKDENQKESDQKNCVCCSTPALAEEENQNETDKQIPKWQKNLIGHWVNHDEGGL